ncbi:MAG: hypothetical protein MJ156_00010 [Alphaproteobacteria bacterium]|nr:hypothetical protein [Alphaproteobacteria bacterium]
MVCFFKKLIVLICITIFPLYVIAEEEYEVVDNNVAEEADNEAVEAITNYDVSDSLFEKITNLEQEKILMQLEKERTQLDLELDRLNAEKIKIQMELDTLSGRAEQQQKELEVAKAELEAQAQQLEQQRKKLESGTSEQSLDRVPVKQVPQSSESMSQKYKLINVVGVGNQLQATLEDLSNGQHKRIAVGKTIDDYTIKSISLDDGIVFEKDGETEILSIGK